jgi:hypothetical protein
MFRNSFEVSLKNRPKIPVPRRKVLHDTLEQVVYIVIAKPGNPIDQGSGPYSVTRDMRPGDYAGALGAQQGRVPPDQLFAFLYDSHLMIAC